MIRQRLQWIGIFSARRLYGVQFFGWNPAPAKLLVELRTTQSYRYTVFPGNTTIEQGAEFTASIGFEGATPDELILHFKTDVESEYRSRLLNEAMSPISLTDSNSNNYTAQYVALA